MRLMLGACFRMFSRSVFMTGQILGILFVVYPRLFSPTSVDAMHLTSHTSTLCQTVVLHLSQ